jgi:hypothetical protein
MTVVLLLFPATNVVTEACGFRFFRGAKGMSVPYSRSISRRSHGTTYEAICVRIGKGFTSPFLLAASAVGDCTASIADVRQFKCWIHSQRADGQGSDGSNIAFACGYFATEQGDKSKMSRYSC